MKYVNEEVIVYCSVPQTHAADTLPGPCNK